MKNFDFDLDLQYDVKSIDDEVGPASQSGYICTPTCNTGTLNCQVSLSMCETC